MYKLSIVNEVNGRTFGSQWESQSEKNEYLDKLIAKQSWGKNQRIINEDDIPEELRSRIISTQVIPQVGEAASEDGTIPPSFDYQPERTEHTVKADYVITEVDLSQDKDYRNKQKIEARKKEYRSIEEVMHIILDKGLDSPEMVALQAERAAIKLKYNLEA